MFRITAILALCVYMLCVAGAWYARTASNPAHAAAVADKTDQDLSDDDADDTDQLAVAAGPSSIDHHGHNPADELPSSQPAAPLNVEGPVFINGFALNLHHTDKIEPFFKAIDEIADMGFNSVEIVTPAFQVHGGSTKIALEVGPGHSPRREDLVAVLNYARKRGLRTVLMPIVLFSAPRGNEWRGKIQPEDWDPWWKSYRQVMDYFTDVANETGVSVFSVGSELLSTEKQNSRWSELIVHIRSRYTGKLSYSTNWDHYHVPVFWKSLDIIGINGYWDLTTLAKKTPPEPEALVERWTDIRKQVMDFGKSQERPVMLTEIGYPSLPWGLKDPWNYVNGSEAKSDPEVQAAGYKAFLDAWSDLVGAHRDPNQLTGVFFYKWDPYGSGAADDTGYGVKGKPTYDLLKKWEEQWGRKQ